MEIELQDYARNRLKEVVDDQKERRSYLYEILDDEKINDLINEREIGQAKGYIDEFIRGLQ